MPMKIMTKEILKRLPKLYATDGVPLEKKIAQVKFFSLQGRGTWFGFEFDPEEKLFFGYVISPLGSDCDEMGYFSLDELMSVRFGCIPGIERDLYFQPKPMAEVLKEYAGR